MEIDGGRIEGEYSIFRDVIKTQKLMMTYPPRFFDDRKKLIYDIAVMGELLNDGAGNQPDRKERAYKVYDDPEITFSRWKAMQLPIMFPPKNSATEYLMREDIFQYENEFEKEAGHFEWHLNFADADLFMGYGGALMAQDELQVAEHPVLASLREMLLDKSEKEPEFAPCTRDDNGNPTPFTIMGAFWPSAASMCAFSPDEARCSIHGSNFDSLLSWTLSIPRSWMSRRNSTAGRFPAISSCCGTALPQRCRWRWKILIRSLCTTP